LRQVATQVIALAVARDHYAIVTQLAQASFSENQLAEGNGEALTHQLVIS
jgi:hypothetical protein